MTTCGVEAFQAAGDKSTLWVVTPETFLEMVTQAQPGSSPMHRAGSQGQSV